MRLRSAGLRPVALSAARCPKSAPARMHAKCRSRATPECSGVPRCYDLERSSVTRNRRACFVRAGGAGIETSESIVPTTELCLDLTRGAPPLLEDRTESPSNHLTPSAVFSQVHHARVGALVDHVNAMSGCAFSSWCARCPIFTWSHDLDRRVHRAPALGRICYDRMTSRRWSLGLRWRRTLTQPQLTGCSRALCFHRLRHLPMRRPQQCACGERLCGCAIDDEVLFRLVIDLGADDGKKV